MDKIVMIEGKYSRELAFLKHQKELFTLYEKGDLEEILSFVQFLGGEFPEKSDNIIYWEASLHMFLSNEEKAIQLLLKGIEQGIWWNPELLINDQSFKTLQENKTFLLIVERCKEIYQEEQINTVSQFCSIGNKKADVGILALHWGGSNIKEFAPFWNEENILKNVFIGFPQSSQLYGYNSYDWKDKGIAMKDIDSEFKTFKNLFKSNQLILAGAGQGGNLAIELSLKKNIKNNGFIAINPEIYKVSLFDKILKNINVTDVRGCIITGDKDPFYDNICKLVQQLKEQGIQCDLVTNLGEGALFPDNFSVKLPELINYIYK
ncbi:group-specific protein [Bacillus thuringiensis MC28]|nr:group-specific protein [Bacillus thuringiensis MC28]